MGSLVPGLSELQRKYSLREQHFEMIRRFETIASMNDRIRNALQVIEYTAYLSNAQAAKHVGQAVDVIDGVLREVLADLRPSATTGMQEKRSTAGSNTGRAKRTSA